MTAAALEHTLDSKNKNIFAAEYKVRNIMAIIAFIYQEFWVCASIIGKMLGLPLILCQLVVSIMCISLIKVDKYSFSFDVALTSDETFTATLALRHSFQTHT